MRIHPLVAGAAVSVMVLSAAGVAAITGVLPGSRAEKTPEAQLKKECGDCGVVVAVKLVEQRGEGTGLGAVVGGVAGAVVGREIGDGVREHPPAGLPGDRNREADHRPGPGRTRRLGRSGHLRTTRGVEGQRGCERDGVAQCAGTEE